jgi:hypothetical protein
MYCGWLFIYNIPRGELALPVQYQFKVDCQLAKIYIFSEEQKMGTMMARRSQPHLEVANVMHGMVSYHPVVDN